MPVRRNGLGLQGVWGCGRRQGRRIWDGTGVWEQPVGYMSLERFGADRLRMLALHMHARFAAPGTGLRGHTCATRRREARAAPRLTTTATTDREMAGCAAGLSAAARASCAADGVLACDTREAAKQAPGTGTCQHTRG